MNLKLQIQMDTIESFTDPRLHEIRKHVEKSPSRFPAYSRYEDKQREIIADVPPEYQKIIDDLVDVMNAQSYVLQYACYLQGLSDGGLSLSQISRSVIFDCTSN